MVSVNFTCLSVIIFQTSELGVTEHIEGDECKFATWTGRTPMAENKVILKAPSIDAKQNWVKKMRQLIQETYFNTALPTISVPRNNNNKQQQNNNKQTAAAAAASARPYSRDFEDGASLDGSIENLERGSLASFGSGNTTDPDNLSRNMTVGPVIQLQQQ